ncbi:T9SS type A sorting domain-containing protein [Sandaracinomonas limnophila]|uniref:T9SS type A sorting domain-containing protein n=1 Tax=Sandaracinomonas limnophila TaxID=1862386 RepID=A0A437PW98_9BACT|nr:T9SS type A sorting domain-containing protein [Sandaracinomonas limnophila]RVU26537.1 T9SS type A sorting domain-containing protein [Sandaracinomonas limnophila]
MKKLLYLFIFFTIINPSLSFGQQFSMSSFGNLNSYPTFSNPTVFKNNNSCIQIENGLIIYLGARSTGEFVITCEISNQLKDNYLLIFPNPLKSNALVKFAKQIPLEDKYILRIYSILGLIVKQSEETGISILNGLNIDFSNLAPGTYFISIESPLFITSTKVLKVD